MITALNMLLLLIIKSKSPARAPAGSLPALSAVTILST